MNSIVCCQFECLSNELLLDIFEYLDGYDLRRSFHGLNGRLNSLLQSSSLHLSYCIYTNKRYVWMNLRSYFHCLQIRVLSLYGHMALGKHIFSSCQEHLRSIYLYRVNRQYVNEICQHIPDENEITSLSIEEKFEYYNGSSPSIIDSILVNHAHRFTSLIKLALLSADSSSNFSQVSTAFPRLRHLRIRNSNWNKEVIHFIEHLTPHLRSFEITGRICSIDARSNSMGMAHINELHINNPQTLMDLRNLFTHFPLLRRLHLEWIFKRKCPFLNYDQWKNLIEEYLPYLKELSIGFDQATDQECINLIYPLNFRSTENILMTCRWRTNNHSENKSHFQYFDHQISSR